MQPRRTAIIAAAALVMGGGGVALLSRGDDDPEPRRAPVGDAMTAMPAGAEAIADIDLAAPLPAVAFAQLLPAHLRADVPRRGRAAIAVQGTRRWLAFPGENGLVTVGGRVARPMTRALFERRVAALPRHAGVRVAFRPAALLRRLHAGIARTRWARALRDGAAAIVVRGESLALPFRLTGARVAAADLPIAPGRAAPAPRGRGRVVIGVRDPAQTLRFARAAGLFPELDVLDRLPRFLRPDLTRLGRDGTLTSDDARNVTVRVEPPDPGDWARTLRRFDALSGLARRLGLADVRIDRDGDAYRVEQHGRFALRVGVYGRALVLSNSERADLRAAANAPRASAVRGGGATLTLLPELLLGRLNVPMLSELVRLGPLQGWVRAEPAQTTGELRLAVPGP